MKHRHLKVGALLLLIALGGWLADRMTVPEKLPARSAATSGKPTTTNQRAAAAGRAEGPRAGNVAIPGVSTVPFERIKQALDQSMGGISAVYFTHRQIQQPGKDPVLSFVYFKSADRKVPPSLAEVAARAKTALEKRQAGQRQMEAARQREDREGMAQAAQQLVQADRAASRAEEFIAVEAGTTTNQPPLMMFQPGLPDWVINADTAASRAAQHLGESAVLAETTRFTLGAQCIYAFTNTTGARLYVDLAGNRIFTNWSLTPNLAARRTLSEAQQQERALRIQRQWDEFLTHGIDVHQFSTERLIDLSTRTLHP